MVKSICSRMLALVLVAQMILPLPISATAFTGSDSTFDTVNFDQENPVKETAPDQSESITIARHYLDREGMMSCNYADLLIEQLEMQNQGDLTKEIQAELAAAKQDYEETEKSLNPLERRIKRRILRDLEILSHAKDPKPQIRKVFQSVCEVAVLAGGGIVRTSALVAAAITSTATMPLRLIYKFGRGMVTANPNPPRRGSLYRMMGNDMGQSVALLPLTLYISSSVFASNPYLAPILAIPAVDFFASKRCANQNPKNPREVRFCANYQKIKDFEYKLTTAGDKGGAAIRTWWDNHIHYRSQREVSAKVCSSSVKHQMKVALRILGRNRDRLMSENPEIYNVKVLPPEPNGCVGILVETNNVLDVPTVVSKIPAVIDGVRTIVTHCDDDQLWVNQLKEAKTDQELENQFCSVTAHWSNIDRSMQNPLASGSEIMRLLINPNALELRQDEIAVKEEKLFRLPFEKAGSFRNVAFLFSPSEEDLKQAEILKPEFEALKAEYKVESKKYQALIKEKNVAACEAKKAELGFNFVAFRKLGENYANYDVFKSLAEVKALKKSYKKAGKVLWVIPNLKLNWELKEVSSKQQIHEELAKGDIANAVFISHGFQNGKLVDGNHDLVPQNFFADVSPSLMSLNFYSCHSDETSGVYHLKETLESASSYYPMRVVSYLGPLDTTIEVLQDTAVNSGLSNYMKRIDKKLFEAMQGNQRYQTLRGRSLKEFLPGKQCELAVDGFEVTKGGYGISLNSQFYVGALPKSAKGEHQFKFPCELLDSQGNNYFTIKNESFVHITDLDGSQVKDTTQIRVLLTLPSGERVSPKSALPVYRASDQNLKSVRFIF